MTRSNVIIITKTDTNTKHAFFVFIYSFSILSLNMLISWSCSSFRMWYLNRFVFSEFLVIITTFVNSEVCYATVILLFLVRKLIFLNHKQSSTSFKQKVMTKNVFWSSDSHSPF